ncbi:MAG: hypothetical protein J6D52_07280 [Clostridia bacterium]|nr:hypothetical protein [Clostridia bacterium]
MKLSKTMEDAISTKDISRIYSSFYTILLSDPGFATEKFNQVFNEVVSRNIEGLIQKYDGKTFESSEMWNQQYWDKVASELMDNFCRERIEHLKEVGKKVYSSNNVEYSQLTNEEPNNIPETQKKTNLFQNCNPKQKKRFAKWMTIGIAGIIVLIIIIALFL